MFKPAVRALSSGNYPDLARRTPADVEAFDEFVAIDIGSNRRKGVDATFTIRVATPRALASCEARDGIVAAWPLLVMRRFDVLELRRWLDRTLEACVAPTWEECIDKLRIHFDYEYSYLADQASPGAAPKPLQLVCREIATEATDFSERLFLELSTKSREHSGRFTVHVATPSGLARTPDVLGIVAERPILVVATFDVASVRKWLATTLPSSGAPTWNRCLYLLSRHLGYEGDPNPSPTE